MKQKKNAAEKTQPQNPHHNTHTHTHTAFVIRRKKKRWRCLLFLEIKSGIIINKFGIPGYL
jgi:hypothetical protein